MDTPLKYILTTDYATLKNDSVTTSCIVNIPATTIASGVVQEYTNTVAVGSPGSGMEYDFEMPIGGSTDGKRIKTLYLYFVENASTANQYDGVVQVFRSSSGTVKVKVSVYKGSVGSLTKTARTITVRIRTFVPPF